MKPEPEACEVCERVALPRSHPCRFEVACSCWYGRACDGSGKVGKSRK